MSSMTIGTARSVARARTITAGFLVVLGLLYVVVLAIYNPGGSVSSTTEPTADADVMLEIDVLTVDPSAYVSTVRMRVVDMNEVLVDENFRTRDELRVGVWSADGPEEITFPAGSAVGRIEATVGMSGDFDGYPFDSYVSSFNVDVLRVGADGSSEPLTVSAAVTEGSSGWRVEAMSRAESAGFAHVELDIARAFSSQFFALLTVAMGLLSATFSLAVGIAVLSGRHFVDSSIVGWGAGLIFSLLALRYYMPGDPPVGVSLDLYAYIWITLMAFVGASMTVLMWLRRPRPEE